MGLTEILLLALINSLFIIGMNRAYGNEMILFKARKYIVAKIPHWLSLPLFDCVWCMASLYSFPIYWPYLLSQSEVTLPAIYTFLIYIPLVSAMSGIIDSKI